MFVRFSSPDELSSGRIQFSVFLMFRPRAHKYFSVSRYIFSLVVFLVFDPLKSFTTGRSSLYALPDRTCATISVPQLLFRRTGTVSPSARHGGTLHCYFTTTASPPRHSLLLHHHCTSTAPPLYAPVSSLRALHLHGTSTAPPLLPLSESSVEEQWWCSEGAVRVEWRCCRGAVGAAGVQWMNSGREWMCSGAVEEQWGAVEDQWRTSGGAVEVQWR
jgi:hypothetical protein